MDNLLRIMMQKSQQGQMSAPEVTGYGPGAANIRNMGHQMMVRPGVLSPPDHTPMGPMDAGAIVQDSPPLSKLKTRQDVIMEQAWKELLKEIHQEQLKKIKNSSNEQSDNSGSFYDKSALYNKSGI